MQESVQSTAPTASSRSSADGIKAEVRRLLPAIRAKAAATERARRVPDEHVEALRDIGFFKLVQPAAFGGDEHDFVVLADLIMDIAQACASTAARVTDKMPFNFLWAGLIHLALPRATIIHCRRAAVDTALSIHQTRRRSRSRRKSR